MSFISLIPGYYVATAVYNLDSKRFGSAPRDSRKEGWTETWGSTEQSSEGSSSMDDDAIPLMLATNHPQLPLVIEQFRPAWLEQIVLRMADVPHVVVNSSHATCEATGPLPFLRDHSDPSLPPAMVGRKHTSHKNPVNPLAQNNILDYLKTHRKIDLDATVKTEQQRSLSVCFLKLIQLELEPLMMYLRYEDYEAWDQVYRRQYLMASSPESDSWTSYLPGRFQALLERSLARWTMVHYSNTMTIEQAVSKAKETYQALELQLSKHGKDFLLGNDKPSLVDAVLWAHLADALCDVHLVVLLADFPHLVKYFQRTYKRYFATNRGDWDFWNQKENLVNAFQKEHPLFQSTKKTPSQFKDAVDLMQSLSLRHHELQQVLDTVKARRSTEPWPTPTHPTDTLLYRWVMGESLKKQKEEDPDESPLRKKLIRDQQRHDQAWISGVVGVSIAALAMIGSAAGPESK
eukprot:Nitzschia sp. Nitz4//scaffold8_size234185//101370//102752//NITZ4_001257-RA/size234185-processed-gene-0.112-mRNA-1//1//CDS//3329559806//6466//frame0